MKLFQQMLVASTALSLIAPFGVQAADINIEGMNSYARSKSSSKKQKKQFNSNSFSNEVVKQKVESLEVNEFDAGVFSDTTTMDAKAIFYTGSVDTEDGTYDGDLIAAFTYQMNLNTSFDGDDNLYIRLKSGNAADWSDIKTNHNTYLSAASGKNDLLTVDKAWYTKPFGENHTFTVGPKIENYYMHATTPSIYKPVLKAFTLGGNAAAYGASTSPGAGWAYNSDSGFAISSNFTSQAGDGGTAGILTDESKSSWATQVGYTKPQYSVSAIVNMKKNSWTDSYFMTDMGNDRPGPGNSTNIGLRAWWRPETTGTATPSLSLGFDTSETDAIGRDNTNAYFVGLNWQDMFNPDDRVGLAFGQPQKHENDPVDPFLYEIYYTYKINDSIAITPAIFGGTDNSGDEASYMKGFVLNTEYKF